MYKSTPPSEGRQPVYSGVSQYTLGEAYNLKAGIDLFRLNLLLQIGINPTPIDFRNAVLLTGKQETRQEILASGLIIHPEKARRITLIQMLSRTPDSTPFSVSVFTAKYLFDKFLHLQSFGIRQDQLTNGYNPGFQMVSVISGMFSHLVQGGQASILLEPQHNFTYDEHQYDYDKTLAMHLPAAQINISTNSRDNCDYLLESTSPFKFTLNSQNFFYPTGKLVESDYQQNTRLIHLIGGYAAKDDPKLSPNKSEIKELFELLQK